MGWYTDGVKYKTPCSAINHQCKELDPKNILQSKNLPFLQHCHTAKSSRQGEGGGGEEDERGGE